MSKPKIDWSKNPHGDLDNDATWLKCENSTLRAKLKDAEAYPIKCIWCGLKMATVDEAAEHVLSCDKGPWVALAARAEAAEADAKLATHKCITCGVAAENHETASKGIYIAEWDSPQAQAVRKVVSERDRLHAEVARLAQDLTNMTYANEQHLKMAESWRGRAVRADELEAEVARLRNVMRQVARTTSDPDATDALDAALEAKP